MLAIQDRIDAPRSITPSPSIEPHRYEVFVDEREADIAARIAAAARGGACTPFQRESWLRTWYATIGRSIGKPMLVTVRDRTSGRLASTLPLVVCTHGGIRTISFADHSVSDDNAPILGPASPVDRAESVAMWRAMRTGLRNGDIIRLTKMPSEIEGRPNPLALLPSVQPSTFAHNIVTIEGRWEAYLAGLKRKVRKELGRSWRVFLQHGGTALKRIDDPDEALRVLQVLERQQSARMHEQGQRYVLDDPSIAEFYRAITAEGVADGSIVLTALMRGDEVIAALLGISDDDRYIMIRISATGGEWTNCSPGRLVIVRTMQMLHGEGYRNFDFSIGDYAYKRRFGTRSRPLYDLTAALTTRGLPLLAYDRARQRLRHYPAVRDFALRVLRPGSRPAAAEEEDE